MKLKVLVLVAGVAVVLCSCGKMGDSMPSEQVGKQALQQILTRSHQNRVELLVFRKTNGQPSVENGVPHYEMEYQGEVEVTEDCYLQVCDARIPNSWPITHPADAWLRSFKVNKGLRVKISGEIKFEKTENGWRVKYGNL